MNAHNNKQEIYIVKRNGQKEPLDINKVHKMTEAACSGLTGVSPSLVEMNSGLQFADGMTTTQIQEILIKSSNDLITLDNPNYQYVAARLLLYPIYKETFGQYTPIPLTKIIDRNSGEIYYGKVPAYSVVVPGSLPNKSNPQGPSLYCAVIVKKVDEKTRSKTSINDLLRD